ncbi:hypothetical protein ACP3V5_17470 [Vibrio maritimus]
MRYLISIVCGALLSACANTNYVIEQDDSLPLQVVKSIKAGSCFEDREVPESTINDVSALGYAGSVGLGVLASSGGLLLGLNNAMVADNKCGLQYGGNVAFLDATKWRDASNKEIQTYLLNVSFDNNPISQEQLEKIASDCNCEVEFEPTVYSTDSFLIKGYKVHKPDVLRTLHTEDMPFSMVGVSISTSSAKFKRYNQVASSTFGNELNQELDGSDVMPIRYKVLVLNGFEKSNLLDDQLPPNHFSIFPAYAAKFEDDGKIKRIGLNISAVRDADQNVYFFVKPHNGVTPHVTASNDEFRKQLTPKGLTYPL